jgi:autotransporter-associated beta strand protein
VSGDKVTIEFNDAPNGLKVDGFFTKTIVNGFMLAGADNKFYNATAAIVNGNQVEVTSPSVAAPVNIRYNFVQAPQSNLCSTEGLPVMAFRTDALAGPADPAGSESLTFLPDPTPPAPAGELQLAIPVSEDAFVLSSSPDTGSSSGDISVRANYISYLKFNIASLPAGAAITSVTLRMYDNLNTAQANGSNSFNLYKVTGAWSETTVTYNTRPAHDTSQVFLQHQQKGNYKNGCAADFALNAAMFAPGNGEYSMAIVDAGASWRNNITQFDSKDSADGQIQNAAGRSIAPTLFINYTTSTLPVITISATDPDASEAGADVGQFRVSRGDALSGALTVNYTIGGTAAAGDYTPALAGSVDIPDGAAAAFININAVNDTDSEGPETLVLTLTSGTDYNIGAASVATVNIVDDDRTVVQINATDPDAHETGPDSGQFTVDRNHNTGNLTVNYSISGTTTSADYSETLGGSVVIPDGSYTATITVTPVNDPDIETDETLILSLNATNDYQLGAATAATVIFHSEDLPVNLPVITISATDPDASEAGADAGQFRVSRGEALSGALTVNYTIGGTAAAGDYTPALPGSVVIPNGQTSADVDVTPLDDLLDESNETIVLTVVSGAGYTVGSPAAATVTIADDDVTPGKAWDGDTSVTWTDGANWVGGSAPASSLTTDIANFNLPTYDGVTVFAPAAPSSGGWRINGITIGGSNGAMLLSVGAGTNRLATGASGITVAAGAGALTIGQGPTAGLQLGANQTWTNNSSSLVTIRSFGNNNGGHYTVTLAGTGTGGFSFGTIGDRSVTATTAVEVDYTAGTVQLLGTNPFTGGLRIKGGQVIVALDNALGNGTVTMGYGGGSSAVSIMNNAATKSYSAPIFLESTHSGTVTIGSTSGQATFTGGVAGTHDLIVGATADVIFSTAGLNYTGNLTKNGGGTLSLGAANTFGGIALVQAGTLRLDHVNALQNSTLDTGTSGAQAVTFNLAGANTYNLGGLQGTDALAIGSNTISVGANNASTTFSGAISGTGGGLTKGGTGTLTLSAANTYTGATQVNSGTLLVNGNQSTASGDVTVDANATLGGIGTLGGNTTIANNGKLQFNLGTAAAGHDALEITSGKALTFSGASTLTITSSGGASPGLYTLVGGGNNIVGVVPATVVLPGGWTADAPVIVGNELRINITSTGGTIQTQYQTWAGGALFDADTNGDGVQDGLAWILGAANKDANALDKLPTATISGGNMIFTFKRIQASINATTALSIEVSTTLTTWPTVYTVGNTTGTSTLGVTVAQNSPSAGTDTVTLTVPLSPDARKFARLKANQN